MCCKMSCSLGAAAFQPGSLHESEMMKMFAGPSRAARQGLATFPPTARPCPLITISTSRCHQRRSLSPRGHAANSEFAYSSHLPLNTRHSLPNRHTLGIKKRRKRCAFNKSRDSNRHIKRSHVSAFLLQFSFRISRHFFRKRDEYNLFDFSPVLPLPHLPPLPLLFHALCAIFPSREEVLRGTKSHVRNQREQLEEPHHTRHRRNGWPRPRCLDSPRAARLPCFCRQPKCRAPRRA